MTRKDVERLLSDWLASSYTVTVTEDTDGVRWQVESNLSSSLDCRMMTSDWQPATQLEKECEAIIRAACEAAGVTFDDVRSTYRKRNVADARRIIARECYDLLGYRYGTEQIGMMLHRDHSSVAYLKNSVDDLMGDPHFRELYNDYKRYFDEFKNKVK